MYEYIENLLSQLPSDMNGSSTTLATRHLFNVNPEENNVPKITVRLFHPLEANYCIYQDVCDKTCKQQLPFYVLGSRHLMKMTIKTH